MGVLDSVLRYKQQQDAEQAAEVQSIPQAIMLYQQGKQTQLDNQIKTLTLQTTMAKNGYAIGPNGRLVKDSSLQSEDDLLDTQIKRAQVGYYNNLSKSFAGQGGMNPTDPADPAAGFGTFVSGTSSRGIPTLKNDTPLAQTERATSLRKELISNPIIKDYQEISSKVNALDGLLAQANKGDNASLGTLDQGLVTLFNKITDPQSVVRESEYARTPEGGSIIARFEGNIQKLQKGGVGLTPALRTQLVSDAKTIADGVGQSYNQILSDYEGMADQYKVPKNLVLGALRKHEGFSKNAPQTFKVGGKSYTIPADEVEAFKKDMGLS